MFILLQGFPVMDDFELCAMVQNKAKECKQLPKPKIISHSGLA